MKSAAGQDVLTATNKQTQLVMVINLLQVKQIPARLITREKGFSLCQ